MISGNLEYLMSSLPHLSFRNTEEVRSGVFSVFKSYGSSSEELGIITILDQEASKFLTEKTWAILRLIRLEHIHEPYFQNSPNSVLAAFSSYMYALKKEITQLRASRKKRVVTPPPKQHKLPLTQGNPLEEEMQLLKWQWDKLEELSIGHYTDFGSLVLYKLKLLLLLRWWSFDQEKGFENFIKSTT
ncbi:MAG: hypothetical protein AAF717_15665 [Bacteroidota bacterium]